jgi:hypothetical protein
MFCDLEYKDLCLFIAPRIRDMKCVSFMEIFFPLFSADISMTRYEKHVFMSANCTHEHMIVWNLGVLTVRVFWGWWLVNIVDAPTVVHFCFHNWCPFNEHIDAPLVAIAG